MQRPPGSVSRCRPSAAQSWLPTRGRASPWGFVQRTSGRREAATSKMSPSTPSWRSWSPWDRRPCWTPELGARPSSRAWTLRCALGTIRRSAWLTSRSGFISSTTRPRKRSPDVVRWNAQGYSPGQPPDATPDWSICRSPSRCRSAMLRLTAKVSWVSVSVFHRASGEAGDVVIEEHHVNDYDRNRSHHRARHQRPPVIDVAPNQIVRHAHRDGLLVGGGGEGERIDELVPGEREGEEKRADEPRGRRRDHDPNERLKSVAAVHERTLFDLLRDRAEVPHEEPGAERHQEGRVCHHQGRDGVGKPESVHHLGKR